MAKTRKLKTIGSRAAVMHNTAKRTSGGLTKSDLMYNKHGRIVSRSKHASAKREMRLKKYGYGTQKGKFGYVKLNGATRKRGRGSGSRRSRRHRGGSAGSLQPANVNSSYMINDVVPQHFTPLDRALTGGRRRRHSRSRSRRQRGGLAIGGVLSPANAMASGIDGQGITNYGASGSNSVQVAAGMAGGRRRRRHRRHRGGTGKPHFAENAALAGALGAAS